MFSFWDWTGRIWVFLYIPVGIRILATTGFLNWPGYGRNDPIPWILDFSPLQHQRLITCCYLHYVLGDSVNSGLQKQFWGEIWGVPRMVMEPDPFLFFCKYVDNFVNYQFHILYSNRVRGNMWRAPPPGPNCSNKISFAIFSSTPRTHAFPPSISPAPSTVCIVSLP